MTEHERIWLEPAGAPDRCWCQDNQWGEEGVEYVLASTLESLQCENERLKKRVGVLIEALQCVRNEFRVEREGGKIGGISHDSKSLPRIIDILETALASTGGEHNGN